MTVGYFVVMGKSYDIIGRDKLEFYIAFASKLGGATGLNRIVKER